MNLDPIKPYADLLKLALVVGFCVALLVAGGCAGYKWGASGAADDLAAKDNRIASLERSLGDFVALYDRMNAQAQEQLAFAEEQRKAAGVAEEAAKRGEAAAAKAADDFESRWQQAAKRKPECAALRATDLEAACGLPLR